MKQTALLDRAQANMRRGKLTRDGFLGTDDRPLIDILDGDQAAVRRLGLTHAEIAARMRHFYEKGKAGLGLATRVAPHFEVQVESVRGRLPCPFGHGGLYAKTNITVRNLVLQEEVAFTELGVHLVEAHGFYQGRGSPYRMAPAGLVRILEIALDTASGAFTPEPES